MGVVFDMFEIKFEKSKTVKGIFEAISAIVDETKMNFGPKGITLNSIDDGRICLVGLKLDMNDCDGYKCDKDYELGLNIVDMVKILRRSGSNDAITFKYNPDVKSIKVLMKSEGSKKARQFSLQLMELGDDGLKPGALESIDYMAKASIPLAYLEEAIKDADIFSETMIVSIADDEGIVFKAQGQIGESECILEKDDEGINDFIASEKGEGTFPLEYLKDIIKIGTITDRVEISLNPNTPIKAKFNILSSSSFTYFLAPRIEEEEEDYDENY